MNAAETADLAATYATLLTDKEMEVRLSAVKEIEKVARSCGAETFSECVLPVFDKVFETLVCDLGYLYPEAFTPYVKCTHLIEILIC